MVYFHCSIEFSGFEKFCFCTLFRPKKLYWKTPLYLTWPMVRTAQVLREFSTNLFKGPFESKERGRAKNIACLQSTTVAPALGQWLELFLINSKGFEKVVEGLIIKRQC